MAPMTDRVSGYWRLAAVRVPTRGFAPAQGFTVDGVDGARSAVEQARQRLNKERPGWQGRIDVGDFVALACPDNHFDAVIDNEAVRHNDFASSCAAYQEIVRELKPAGKLFLRTIATGSTGDGTGEPFSKRAWCAAEGAMQGKGLSRLTDEEDFGELFGGELAMQSC